NGYKINNPTLLARITHGELRSLFEGYGWKPYFVEGSEPDSMHQAMAATTEKCVNDILAFRQETRATGAASRPRWPMIVLRTPKGWSAPLEVSGHRLEGFWRAHQVPLGSVKKDPEQLRILEQWMQAMRPHELFDQNGKLDLELKELAPAGQRRMGSNPHTNGGQIRKPLRMPDFRSYAVSAAKPGTTQAENTRPLGALLRDI